MDVENGQRVRRQLGWAAVTLGLMAVGSVALLPERVDAVLAVLAVGIALGVVDVFTGLRSRARGWVPTLGLALCVAALAVVTVRDAPTRSLHPAPAAASDDLVPQVRKWGEQYTWPGGVTIKVAVPTVCKPDPLVVAPGVRAVAVQVTVDNDGDKPLDTTTLLYTAKAMFAGYSVRWIESPDHPGGSGTCPTDKQSTTVMPGRSLVFNMSYPVGSKTDEMQVALRPNLTVPQAVFVGSV